MHYARPTTEQLFGGDPNMSAAEQSRRYDEYLSKLDHAPSVVLGHHNHPAATERGIDFNYSAPRSAMEMLERAMVGPDLAKAMSGEDLASVASALAELKASRPDLTKDISLTSPVATGLVAYDLEAPAKMLTPKPTPERNRLPRRKGIGVNHQFKRITGFTGTGTGGVGVAWPGITSSTQTNFANPGSSNQLNFNRGPKISYAGDSTTVPYQQFGLSDQTDWASQFSGQQYQDIRALSRSSTLFASMLMEERMIISSRGTASPFLGTLAAPTGLAVSAGRSTAGSEVGITNATGNLYVRVVAENADWGVSQATSISSAGAYTTGQVVDVTYTLPAGATGARVFIALSAGADPGDSSRYLYTTTAGTIYNGRSGFNKLTIQGTIPTTGTVPTAYTKADGTVVNLTSTDGGSAYSTGYDGYLAYCTGPNAGYTKSLNTTFSTSNAGVEYQTAFAALYLAVKADPDRIMMAAQDRVQLSDSIKNASGEASYQLLISQSEVGGYKLGSLVTGIQNESTGKMCTLDVHPWMFQGNSLILSDTLPIPDSQVDSVFAMWNVQDFMGIDWPVLQHSYDTSTYWYGAMVCYAPAWCGSVTGIQNSR